MNWDRLRTSWPIERRLKYVYGALGGVFAALALRAERGGIPRDILWLSAGAQIGYWLFYCMNPNFNARWREKYRKELEAISNDVLGEARQKTSLYAHTAYGMGYLDGISRATGTDAPLVPNSNPPEKLQ